MFTRKKKSDEENVSLVSWLEEKEIPEETAAKIMAAVEDLKDPDADPTSAYELLLQGADYEKAVLKARMLGETDGRNSSVEELMKIYDDSDGVPHPGSAAGASPARKAPSIFDLARTAF